LWIAIAIAIAIAMGIDTAVSTMIDDLLCVVRVMGFCFQFVCLCFVLLLYLSLFLCATTHVQTEGQQKKQFSILTTAGTRRE
jgi:hypothetical protein